MFPIQIESVIQLDTSTVRRTITMHGGLTVLIGPNGSGKTHLMRGMRGSLTAHSAKKKVRFLSAGRVGLMEQWRSDFNGHQGATPNYRNANYGSVSDTARRHNYETLEGDFQTLGVRTDILIKIRERLRKLFGRNIVVLWDGGSLKIEFVRTAGGSGAYSSAREASGLLHLAGLLAALYDDEVGALLIDEPEVSLHPQLQAFLLREILSVAGLPDGSSNKKLVVISTHSTEFLKIDSPQDLPNLVFCSDFDVEPVQIPADAGELKSSKVAGLIARMGQEHKVAFFARAPLLVEGPSDAIICGALAGKLEVHIEAGGSQLLPVIGKGQFPVVVKLLRMAGKSPIVLVDADGLADGLELVNTFLTNSRADALASAIGFASATEMSRNVFASFCDIVDSKWAGCSHIAETHAYWVHRDPTDHDTTKAKRRAALASLLAHTPSDLTAQKVDPAWLVIKQRLTALLDLLETQGCFVLRRGTIESYYSHASGGGLLDKPAAATEEAIAIRTTANLALEERYGDVLRCLRRAASVQRIVEAESLQDLLLAAAAPALSRLKNGQTTESFNALARSTLGTSADLFDLENAEGKLKISMKSKVLDVPGFPMLIAPDADVVKAVGTALQLDQSGS